MNADIFKEYDIRGKYPEEIDEPAAFALAVAFAGAYRIKRIAIGRDARPESAKIFWALAAGLVEAGATISDLGVCATPELFFAVGEKSYDGGIMVTASHSPLGETGLKFCDRRGRALGLHSGLKKIKSKAEKYLKAESEKIKPALKNNIKQFSAKSKNSGWDCLSIIPEYRKFLQTIVKPSKIKGFRLILDTSSGSASRVVEAALSRYPIESRKINFRANDNYPDHGPNPLLPENRQEACSEVMQNKADFGVVFDGDGDRAIFIDDAGKFVEPYWINCLMSKIILEKFGRNELIIDARLDLAISKTIKEAGGVPLSHRSGYANIISTMSRKKLIFGCENSGHFMFNFTLAGKGNYAFGDAILPILLICEYLKISNQKLSQAIAPLTTSYKISGELNFKQADFKKINRAIRQKYFFRRTKKIDGLSVYGQKGSWFFNIRPSHTEPLVRINVEADSAKELVKIKKEVIALIK